MGGRRRAASRQLDVPRSISVRPDHHRTVFLGVAIATVLAIGSVPIWIVWNRRPGLRLDLPWRALVPRAWWHLTAAPPVLGGLFASCVIAFPAPPSSSVGHPSLAPSLPP